MSAIDTLRVALYGDPPSESYKPSREVVLAAATEMRAEYLDGISQSALISAIDVAYATRAELELDLAYDAPAIGWVYGDSTDANNDLYTKSGASGAGSWTLTTALHDIVSGEASTRASADADIKSLSNGFATWSALSSFTGMEDGDRTTVYPSDTGTHTPVTGDYNPAGGGTPNSGRFEYSSSESDWVRYSSYYGDASQIEETADAKIMTANERMLVAALALLSGSFPSLAAANARVLDFDPSDYGFIAHWGQDAVRRMKERLSEQGLSFPTTEAGLLRILAANASALRVDENGRFEGVPSYAFSRALHNSLIASGDLPRKYPERRWVAVGDSMTALQDLRYLIYALGGFDVVNFGVGSQTAEEILARLGIRPALLSVTGNEIPASGTVGVTAYNTDALYNSGRSGDISIAGTIGGVHCTWSGNNVTGNHGADTSTILTRTTAGSAVKIAPGTPFIPDALASYRNRTIMACFGRNQIDASGAPITTSTLTDTEVATRIDAWEKAALAIDSIQTTQFARVLHRGVTTTGAYGTNPTAGETSGTQGWKLMTGINARGKTLFGERFVDERGYLIAHATTIAAAIGVTLNSYDTADIAADTVPRSFRNASDITHYTSAVFQWLNANLYAPRAAALGWI